MKKTGIIIGVTIMATAALALAILGGRSMLDGAGPAHAVPAGTVDEVAIDMDPLNTPANPANGTLGTRETCISKVSTDVFDIDVTIKGIDPADMISGYQFDLNYDGTKLNVTGITDTGMILSAGGSTIPVPLSDPVPDSDGLYTAAAADFGANAESGDGVLARIQLTSVSSGVSALTLSGVIITDGPGGPIPTITAVLGAEEAQDTPCPQPADVQLVSQDVTLAGAAAPIPVSVDSALTVDKVIRNLGPQDPVDVDITKTITLSPDCTLNGQPNVGPYVINDTVLAVPVGQDVPFQELGDLVHCTQPSDHTLTVENCLTAVGVTDPVPGNNCDTDVVNFTVTAQSDLEVVTVAVTGPVTQATVGTAFTVTATATVHNIGGFGPTNANVSVTLNLPSGCTTTDPNPQSGLGVTLPVSQNNPVNVAWPVTCTSESFHTFTADGSVAVNQTHVTDPVPGNNGPVTSQGTDIPVYDEADVKVQSVVVTAPAIDQAINTPFNVTADVTLHNNGPFPPIIANTDVTLNLPADCSVDPQAGDTNPVTVQGTQLGTSAATPLGQISWSVTCTQPSTHVFSADADTGFTVQHVIDPSSGNNSNSGQDTVNVTADADVEVVDVTLTAPDPITAGEAFNATVDATLDNNGPFGPVNADATVSLSQDSSVGTGTDCTFTPDSDQVAQDISLAVNTPTAMPQQSWSVTCTDDGAHGFSAQVVVAIDQLHLSDTDSANDSVATDVLQRTLEPAPEPSPTPTPTATPSQLPSTGSGLAGGSDGWIATYVAAVAILALIGAAVLYRAQRRRSHNR